MLIHLNPEFALAPSLGIISAGLYNLLQSVQTAKVFEIFLMSNSFLAMYAVDENSINRIGSIFFKTRLNKLINELIPISGSLNLSWNLKIKRRITDHLYLIFLLYSDHNWDQNQKSQIVPCHLGAFHNLHHPSNY